MSGVLLIAAVLVAAAIGWLIYLDWRASRLREESVRRARTGGEERRSMTEVADEGRRERRHVRVLPVREVVGDTEFSSETFIPPESLEEEPEKPTESKREREPREVAARRLASPGWEHPIPWSYGETRLALLVRDPYWVFSYWELTDEVHRAAEERVGRETWFHARPVLRVYDVTAGSHYDIGIDEHTRNWYVNVGQPDRTWYAEIGRITEEGEFVMLARSNRVHTPRDMPSDVVDWRWAPLHHRYRVGGFWPEGMPASPGAMPGSPGAPSGPENPWRSSQ